MIQEFEKYIKNIQKISSEERKNRSKSLEIFNNEGFPNKKLEDWKFTDIKKIILDNFTELKPNENSTSDVKINFIKILIIITLSYQWRFAFSKFKI